MQPKILLFIGLVAFVDCSINRSNNSGNKLVNTTVQTGWIVKVIGEVVDVDKMNVDKSGKNPKYMIYFQMKVESFDDDGEGLELKSPILFQGKEREVVDDLGRLPKDRRKTNNSKCWAGKNSKYIAHL